MAQIVQPPLQVDLGELAGELPPPADLVGAGRKLVLAEDPRRCVRPLLTSGLDERERLLVERQASPLPCLGRRHLQPFGIANRVRPIDGHRLVDDQPAIDHPIPSQPSELGTTSTRHRRQTQSQRCPRVNLLGRHQGNSHVVDRHHAPRRLLSTLGLCTRHRVRWQQLPPHRLAECRSQQCVEVSGLRFAHAAPLHAQVPAIDLGDRDSAHRPRGDLVGLDALGPAGIVATRRQRPRRALVLEVLVEQLGHGQLFRPRRRARGQLRGEALGVTPTAPDRLRDLYRLALVVVADEDPHLPVSRPLLPHRRHVRHRTIETRDS